MRQWWIEEVKQIGDYDGPYATVTINEPSSVFEDKQIDYNMVLDDYHSNKWSNAIKSNEQQKYHQCKRSLSMELLDKLQGIWKYSIGY